MDDKQIQLIIEGVTKKVDDRLGEAFALIDARLEAHANANLSAHAEQRQATEGLRSNLEVLRRNQLTLWRHVRGPGSDPPEDGSLAPLPSEGLDAKTSAVDLEVDALRGEMITGFTKLERKVEERHEENKRELLKQTEHLETLANVARHPLAKQLAIALVTAALTWLGMHAAPEPKLPMHALEAK